MDAIVRFPSSGHQARGAPLSPGAGSRPQVKVHNSWPSPDDSAVKLPPPLSRLWSPRLDSSLETRNRLPRPLNPVSEHPSSPLPPLHEIARCPSHLLRLTGHRSRDRRGPRACQVFIGLDRDFQTGASGASKKHSAPAPVHRWHAIAPRSSPASPITAPPEASTRWATTGNVQQSCRADPRRAPWPTTHNHLAVSQPPSLHHFCIDSGALFVSQAKRPNRRQAHRPLNPTRPAQTRPSLACPPLAHHCPPLEG